MKNIFSRYIYLFIVVGGSFLGAYSLFGFRKEKTFTGNEAYLNAINNREEFDFLKGEPLSDTYSNVECVKVTYDLKAHHLYFVNSTRYRYHYDFCTKVLGYYQSLEVFNACNYSRSGLREFYLGNLNYFKDLDTYVLDFASEDMISASQVKELLGIVRNNTYFGDSIKLFINTDHLASLDASGLFNVPKIYPSDIYGKQQFQSINNGTCYGFIRMVDNLKENYSDINAHDIIVIKGTPLDLPVCAGVLTNSFQTPLSHVNVLCHNRKTPSAAQVNLWDTDAVSQYADQLVKLTVSTDSFLIEPVSEKEAQDFWKKEKQRDEIFLTYNLDVKNLLLIPAVKPRDKIAIGSKAYGFSQLYDLQQRSHNAFYTPEGAFAIPFFFYQQHIKQTSIETEIEKLYRDSTYTLNNDSLKTQLKKIRKAIKDAPLNESLLSAVENQMRAGNCGNSFRFRSSSNAEDLAGFNGAGLYDSKTGILGDTAKSVERAIKEVWASVWTLRAFNERTLYNINHKTVMMGILVHRNFPDEKANGVAITRNIYRKNFPGFTINVQKDEVSVVAPPDGVTCDQLVITASKDINPASSDISTEYLTYSSINNHQPVLTQEQLTILYKALEWVKHHFYETPGYPSSMEYYDFAVDVEFKFDKNGVLYIKQVRPFN